MQNQYIEKIDNTEYSQQNSHSIGALKKPGILESIQDIIFNKSTKLIKLIQKRSMEKLDTYQTNALCAQEQTVKKQPIIKLYAALSLEKQHDFAKYQKANKSMTKKSAKKELKTSAKKNKLTIYLTNTGYFLAFCAIFIAVCI